MPMFPLAPGRGSTITGCPQFAAIFSLTGRVMRSRIPPGGNGSLVTERVGYFPSPKT